MKQQPRGLRIFALIATALLAYPTAASAQGNPVPDTNIPIPSLPELGIPNGGAGLPNVQQFPGGLQILFPQGPTITITDPTGMLFPPSNGPSAPPSAPNPAPNPGTPPSWSPNWPAPTNPGLPPVQPPGPGATQPGQGGRVLGVFVGITNYSSGNDLPYCAEDATRLANAFVQAGIIAQSDAVVLTDHQATRGNVTAAIQRLGSRMNQNDTLVFFFSGHGDRRPDTNGDEVDGMDETIILTDGALLDDELTALLQASPARDFVALDSCFAGGFEQDVARLPQSVGFYSSGETETSSIASELGAGGYLSHFMRTGIEGSRGRQLQVWSLQQHIQQGYMSSGANGRQNLVVGVGPGASRATVLFDANRQPATVASR